MKITQCRPKKTRRMYHYIRRATFKHYSLTKTITFMVFSQLMSLNIDSYFLIVLYNIGSRILYLK